VPDRFARARTRLRPLALLAPVAAVLALAGCGGAGGNENADPAAIAPKTSLLYFTAYVRPQGAQKAALESISRKLLGAANPGQRIEGLIDRALRRSRSRPTYRNDVAPWLGRRAAFVATSLAAHSSAALIVAVKDTGKAKAALDKFAGAHGGTVTRSYKGVDYRVSPSGSAAAAVVGDYLVVGAESELRAIIDASQGQSLKDSATYSQLAGPASGKLAFGYVDTKDLLASLGPASQIPTTGALQALANPVTLTLDATPSQVTIDIGGPAARVAAPAHQAALIGQLPGDSWAALAIPNVGASLRQVLAQLGSGGIGASVLQSIEAQLRASTGLDLNRDVLAALGDIGLFARGASLLTLGGGLVISAPDPAAAQRLVTKLDPLIARAGARGRLHVAPTTVGGARGFKVTGARFPGNIDVVAGGGRIVAAYGDAATREALRPTHVLASSATFQRAAATLGPGASTAVFVDFAPLAQLLSAVRSPRAATVQHALSALDTLAIGGGSAAGRASARLVLTLK
jgi:hypothetical protein